MIQPYLDPKKSLPIPPVAPGGPHFAECEPGILSQAQLDFPYSHPDADTQKGAKK
ncbi:unnamed protein product [marine sediment metagenome]|uniref:Uncharacterized protein n=1 Tax=marine sediment metagenome TaxID=412755 RepID=X1H0U1_9ZZZZ